MNENVNFANIVSFVKKKRYIGDPRQAYVITNGNEVP